MFHISMKAKMDALEAQKAGLEAKLAALPAVRPVILYPGIADVYAAKVSDLAAALNDAESRPEAVEILRGLIEKIVLRPDADAANGHVVELFGEASTNAAFKRRVAAALAGQSGPEAIAKLIDRRLAGLERARAFVDWEKARAFRDDLAALLASIRNELAPADPDLGTDRLLRFVATHKSVFERIDDSSGKLQDVYEDGIVALGPIVARLSPEAARPLPDWIMDRLGELEHGYLPRVADQVIPHLASDVLSAWEEDLARRSADRHVEEAPQRATGRWFYSMTDQWRQIRQSIARARGDLDHLIALEGEKSERGQDTLGLAETLRDAGRLEEALDWVRKGGPRAHSTLLDFLDDADDSDSPAVRQALLEADILKRLDRREEARGILWDRFRDTLAPPILRAHLRALPDFEDVAAEEKAMAVALDHSVPLVALRFFLDWKRPDLAARVVIAHRGAWSGSDWHILPAIAETLEAEQPLAATLLYRVLLEDILTRARSKAYPHGAKYLQILDRLGPASDADPARPQEMDVHATYRAALKANHGRKSGFWGLVEGRVTREPEVTLIGRRPLWRES